MSPIRDWSACVCRSKENFRRRSTLISRARGSGDTLTRVQMTLLPLRLLESVRYRPSAHSDHSQRRFSFDTSAFFSCFSIFSSFKPWSGPTCQYPSENRWEIQDTAARSVFLHRQFARQGPTPSLSQKRKKSTPVSKWFKESLLCYYLPWSAEVPLPSSSEGVRLRTCSFPSTELPFLSHRVDK